MTDLRSLRDLLAVVPYLLGFHPAESLVLLALRGREITFQVRADLPDPRDVPDLSARLAAVVRRQVPTSVIILGYGPGARTTPLVLGVQAAVEAAGIPVLDALRVADGRYWSYLCTVPSCCPPDGQPYDLATSPVTTEAIVAGQVIEPSREAFGRRLDPVAGAQRHAMTVATDRARERLLALGGVRPLVRAGRVAVDDAVARQREGVRLSDDEVAWLSLVLVHRPVRDRAWACVGGDFDLHVALWTDVLRRCEPELVVAPATLLAFAAWRAGDGAVASIALSRALSVDPGYPMAILMARALMGGLAPSEWPVGA
jgi:hypothetical protein